MLSSSGTTPAKCVLACRTETRLTGPCLRDRDHFKLSSSVPNHAKFVFTFRTYITLSRPLQHQLMQSLSLLPMQKSLQVDLFSINSCKVCPCFQDKNHFKLSSSVLTHAKCPYFQNRNHFELTFSIKSQKICPYFQNRNHFTLTSSINSHEVSPYSRTEITLSCPL